MTYTHLHTYKCPRCKPLKILTTPVKAEHRHPYRCNFCTSWMRFAWSEAITTEAQQALARRGVVFDPYSTRVPWTCVRCGEQQTSQPLLRVDGTCCRACYRAEDHPPAVLLTPEQIAEKQAQRTAFRRDMDDAHERAHQLAEQEQR